MMMAGAILDEAAERFLGKVPFRETDIGEAKYLGEGAAGSNALCRAGEKPVSGCREAREIAVREEVNQFQVEIDANNIQAWGHLKLSPQSWT